MTSLRYRETTTNGGDLVSIGIADIGCVEIWAVMQSQARSAVATSTIGQRSGMKFVDGFPGSRAEGDHATVSNCRWLFVERFSDPESQFPRAPVFVYSPASRSLSPFRVASDTSRHAERR